MVTDPHNHAHPPHGHPAGHSPEMHDPPDEWHRHTADEERPQSAHGELANPGRILGAGGFAFLLVAVSSVAVYMYYISFTTRQLDIAEQRGLEADVLRSRQEAADRMQRGNVWADEAKGFVQLPIDTAKRRVIDQYVRQYRSGSTPRSNPSTPE
jgi:hypothetical protein